MIIYKKAADISAYLLSQKIYNESIGFVPTMGALHSGHIELITTAKANSSIVVSSIFVNPTQFNDPKDFEKYPITIEKDIFALEKAGCDVLFLPVVAEMYPDGLITKNVYPLGFLDTILDAAYRPGHFQGVCQVVNRLLEIVEPHKLFLGQKDYQQCMVLKKLINLIGMETTIIICPTKREASGLAMSSRNMRLNEPDKIKAAEIFETLSFISREIKQGDLSYLKEKGTAYLTKDGFKVDYVEIANANTLELIENWDGKTPLVILIAAFLSGVRLIDNIVVTKS